MEEDVIILMSRARGCQTMVGRLPTELVTDGVGRLLGSYVTKKSKSIHSSTFSSFIIFSLSLFDILYSSQRIS